MPQVLVVLPVLGFPWSADCFQTPVPVTACRLIAVQVCFVVFSVIVSAITPEGR